MLKRFKIFIIYVCAIVYEILSLNFIKFVIACIKQMKCFIKFNENNICSGILVFSQIKVYFVNEVLELSY
jgi:hypothetical protein